MQRFTNQLEIVSGTANIININEPAKLLFSFDGAPMSSESNYMIVETDFTCFALVYNCQLIAGKKIEASWILSRSPTLASSKINELKDLLRLYGVDTAKFTAVDQNC